MPGQCESPTLNVCLLHFFMCGKFKMQHVSQAKYNSLEMIFLLIKGFSQPRRTRPSRPGKTTPRVACFTLILAATVTMQRPRLSAQGCLTSLTKLKSCPPAPPPKKKTYSLLCDVSVLLGVGLFWAARIHSSE